MQLAKIAGAMAADAAAPAIKALRLTREGNERVVPLASAEIDFWLISCTLVTPYAGRILMAWWNTLFGSYACFTFCKYS